MHLLFDLLGGVVETGQDKASSNKEKDKNRKDYLEQGV
jgi:hypothetical protein